MNTLLIIAIVIAGIILFIGIIKMVIKLAKKTLQPKDIHGGIPATAVITDFHKGGGQYSQPSGGLDYVYKMFIGLMITDQNGNTWETHTNEFVLESQFNMYRIGDILHIKYDPTNKNNVVLDGAFHKRYQP